jgi:hypothetical protein
MMPPAGLACKSVRASVLVRRSNHAYVPILTVTGTQKVETARCQIGGKWVTLIDTPGFDDTDLSDTDILELIAQFLATTYQHKKFLSGIILLQPINTNRVQGTEKRRTRLFEKVCGQNASPNIVIGTTMWSEMSDQAEGNRRTRERMADKMFWGAMVGEGARVEKHNDGSRSARRIVKMVLDKKAVVLQLQSELVAKDGKIIDTSAGKQLEADLGQTSAKYQLKIQDLRSERNAADEIRELRAQLEEVEADRERLKKSRVSFSSPLVALPKLRLSQSPRGRS